MSDDKPTIIYTLTDEAPLLATDAFLPIIRTFTEPAGIKVETSDISVAARILAEFSDCLTEEQSVPDNLGRLGELTQDPDTNIIKLPNISASVPQLLAAIKELKGKGYDMPDYPGDPKTDEEKEIKERYAKVLGSAVNPVLREGNSDRRAPNAVKEYARRTRTAWPSGRRRPAPTSHDEGRRLLHGEKSMTLDRARKVKMELRTKSGKTIVLKPKVALEEGEIIDSMFMSKKALRDFYEGEIEDALQDRRDVLAARQGHDDEGVAPDRVRPRGPGLLQGRIRQAPGVLDSLGVNVNNGMVRPVQQDRDAARGAAREIMQDIHACHEHRPELAMVDSAKGITNFHSPSDVIVDASMPAMIRRRRQDVRRRRADQGSQGGQPRVAPSPIYQEMINFCKWARRSTRRRWAPSRTSA